MTDVGSRGPAERRVSSAPALLAAALSLPGVLGSARADAVPDAQVGLRWLEYRDGQPGAKRIRVSAPSTWFVAPVGDAWSVAGTLGVDRVSGASPAWHAATSSASSVSDRRTAGDWRIVRHGDRHRVGLGLVHSDERDYRSRALALDASLDSDDGNTTGSIAAGLARDRLEPVAGRAGSGTRRSFDVLASVTHVPTPRDVVQAGLGYARHAGDLSDPYKALDRRPDTREQALVQLRWNHHVADGPFAGTTLRTSYRHYRDTHGVRAHTASLEWVHPLPHGWSVAPLVRGHTQSAARFYYDPVYDATLGEPFPPGFVADPTRPRTSDTRLSAFGALTVGLRIALALPSGWQFEVRAERYRQRSAWRAFGEGSPGLPGLDATIVQGAVIRRF